jgi:hypothetical protein
MEGGGQIHDPAAYPRVKSRHTVGTGGRRASLDPLEMIKICYPDRNRILMHNSLDGRKQNTNVVMSKQYAQLPCVACTSNSYFDTEGSDYKLGTKELVR